MFSLQLNERILGFNYRIIKNKMSVYFLSVISDIHIREKHSIMSVSKMLSLIRYLGQVIGYFAPYDDSV